MKNVYLDVDYGRDLSANITENFKYREHLGGSITINQIALLRSKRLVCFWDIGSGIDLLF